jgi:hypothetical protein
MNRSLVVFIGSAVLAGLLGTASWARAAYWFRTVEGSACEPFPYPMSNSSPDYPTEYRCAFPSDTIEGATSISGNRGVSSIFADYAVGEAGARDVNISACGVSYNHTGGSCGTPFLSDHQTNGYYDIGVPLWAGTGSGWDYFYVDLRIRKGGYIKPIGIGVAGAN